jgi:hypothetical protein
VVKLSLVMKAAAALLAMSLFSGVVAALEHPSPAEPKSITVPFTLDHNRMVVNVEITLPDGSARRVPAWVDNGNPDFEISRRIATLLNLNVTCGNDECSAPPPDSIDIGGMKISLTAVKEASIPLEPVSAAAILEPGMAAEINFPSTVLRNYDVLIDFPARMLSIGKPGTLKFEGISSKTQVNAANGLIQIPSEIENKKCNLALDLGSSISFLSEEIFDRLAAAHRDWPQLTGAVGPANMWGLPDEPKWKLMRLDRLHYGPLHLTDLPVVEFPKDRMDFFEKRAGISTAGLLGSEALVNYRVGIDYAHAMVYFDIGRMVRVPDFDVIGLVLRPENDGRFTILGVADFDGKPSVPEVQAGDHLISVDGLLVPGSTMGQVWPLLQGAVGKERKLVVERAGKEFTVTATVQHFLGDASPKEDSAEKK